MNGTDDGSPSTTVTANALRTPRWRLARTLGFAAIMVWAFAVGAGLEYIWAYSSKPGAADAGPPVWPGSKLIKPRAQQPTLIMFVHPQCPCSRASIEELRIAMERARGPMSVWVLFLRPEGTDATWEDGALWKAATAIAQVNVVSDHDGSEAARFGASTSGHTVLYDAQGRFLFSGGITGSRGHVGDNAGLKQVLNLLEGKAAPFKDFPVFGCSLHDPKI